MRRAQESYNFRGRRQKVVALKRISNLIKVIENDIYLFSKEKEAYMGFFSKLQKKEAEELSIFSSIEALRIKPPSEDDMKNSESIRRLLKMTL
jgi:hypothetical protein